MTDADREFDQEEAEAQALSEEAEVAKKDIQARCTDAGLTFEEQGNTAYGPIVKVGIKCGRDVRLVILGSDKRIVDFSSTPFEKYNFLAEYNAICSYSDGTIEAAIRPSNLLQPWGAAYRRLFGVEAPATFQTRPKHNLVLEPPRAGFPRIEIGPQSEDFSKIVASTFSPRMTLKLSACSLTTHDQSLALLKKVAGAAFFQIDLISNIPLALDRRTRRNSITRRLATSSNVAKDLQYPKTEFDDAPLSLYSYGRSASGMPLLQFLAFYQVIEFYFPIYSHAEAQRKLKAILKDPGFRGDRDADIARLLSSIRISRGGGYGDERSQLRATLMECVDPDALRRFLESDANQKEFYLSKSKGSPYHRIPLANPTADLRGDAAERMYDIRCKIVHTKNESRDGEVELLLPFSSEADQLSFDIDLARYLAQSTLIAGSLPFQLNG